MFDLHLSSRRTSETRSSDRRARTPRASRSRRRHRPGGRSLLVEQLESRTLLATLDLVGGQLTYTAGPGVGNMIVLSAADGNANYLVTDYAEDIQLAAGASDKCVQVDAHNVKCPVSLLADIRIDTGDGTNLIRLTAAPVSTSLIGGGKNVYEVTQSGVATSADVTIVGGTDDEVRVGTAGSSSESITVSTMVWDQRIKRNSGGPVWVRGVRRIDVVGSPGADTFNVDSILDDVRVSLCGSEGADVYRINQTGVPKKATLEVRGNESGEQVFVNAEGYTTVIADSGVTQLDSTGTGATDIYSRRPVDLEVTGGSGNDTFYVLAKAISARGKIILDGRAGEDTYEIDYAGSGDLNITARDSGNSLGDTLRLSRRSGGDSVVQVSSEGIRFESTPPQQKLTIGSMGVEDIFVADLHPGSTSWEVTALPPDAKSLSMQVFTETRPVTIWQDGIWSRQQIFIDGSTIHTDVQVVSHSAVPETITVQISDRFGRIVRSNCGPVDYGNLDSMTVQGGSAGDRITLNLDNALGLITADGGAGDDWIETRGNLGKPGETPDHRENGLTLLGGSGNDTIIGTAGAELIDGGPGDDVLLGRGGADILVGGPGMDVIIAGDAQARQDPQTPNSADLAVDAAVTSPVKVGQNVTITFTVYNRGEDAAINPDIEYWADGAIELPPETRQLGELFLDPITGLSTGVRVLRAGAVEVFAVQTKARRVGDGMVTGLVTPGQPRVVPDPVSDNNLVYKQVDVKPRATALEAITPLFTPGTGGSMNGAFSPRSSGDGYSVVFYGAAPTYYGPGLTPNNNSQIWVGDPVLASVSADGTTGGDGFSFSPVTSQDGSVVAFRSAATNLVPGFQDLNGYYNYDIFARNLTTGVTQLVSSNAAGTGTASAPPLTSFFLSSDGRYVVYCSGARDVLSQPNYKTNVFLRDLQQGTTELVSVSRDGGFPDRDSDTVWGISADGRYVLFTSSATNLLAQDSPRVSHLYLRDRVAGTTTLVDVNADGTGPSDLPVPDFAALSPDGRYVVFKSRASNLVAGVTDTNATEDIFWRDLQTGVTKYVTWTAAGTPNPNPPDTQLLANPLLSDDGQFVAFQVAGAEYVAGFTSAYGLYVRDLAHDTTQVVNLTADGIAIAQAPTNPFAELNGISGDGRYVLFGTNATDIVPGITESATSIWARYLYVRDRLTGQATLINRSRENAAATDNAGALFGAALSADGQVVYFSSDGTNLTRNRADRARTVDLFTSAAHVALTYVAPSGSGANQLTLRRNGDNLELIDDGTGQVVATRALADTQAAIIDGSLTDDDTLTIDFSGGLFSLPSGVQFDGGTAGNDRIVVAGGSFTNVWYESTGAGSGVASFDGLAVQFTTLEGFTDTTAAANRGFHGFLPGDQQILVRDDGDAGNGLSVIEPGTTGVFVPVTFTAPTAGLTVASGDGNDTLTVQSLEAGFAFPVRLEGGKGNDVLDASAFTGAATLDGGFGNDTLLGGPGDTTYVETPGSTDTVTDTGGNDTLDFSNAFLPVTVDLDLQDTEQTVDAAGNKLVLNGQVENVTGSRYADVFVVDPLGVPRNIDGGPNEPDTVDSLQVCTQNATATNDGVAVQVPGFAPINFGGGVTNVSMGTPPDAIDDYAITQAGLGLPVTIAVMANDTDAEGDAFVVTAITQPDGGTAVLNADGTVTYTPKAGFVGETYFDYTIADVLSGTDTAQVTVLVNQAPVAEDDMATTGQNTAVEIDVLWNDSDPGGDEVWVTGVTNGAHGTATVIAGGYAVSYSPQAGFHGQDTFTYTLSDGYGGTDTATVTVTVNDLGLNEPPTIDAVADVVENEDTLVTVTLTVGDDLTPITDLTITAVSSNQALVPDADLVVAGGASRALTITPAANAFGVTQITVTVTDADGEIAVATFQLTVREVPFPYRNPQSAFDVNRDGQISPLDVLTLINSLNVSGSRQLLDPPGLAYTDGDFLDVSPDNWLTPLDVLTEINDINLYGSRSVSAGEGEAWSVSRVGSAIGSRRLSILAESLTAAQGEAPLSDVDSGPGHSGRSGAASGSCKAPGSACAGQSPQADEPVRGGGECSRSAAAMQRLQGPATARAADEDLVLGGDIEDSLSDFADEVAELWLSGG